MSAQERTHYYLLCAGHGGILGLAIAGPSSLTVISHLDGRWFLTGVGVCLLLIVVVLSNVYGRRYISHFLARTQWAVDQGLRPEDIVLQMFR